MQILKVDYIYINFLPWRILLLFTGSMASKVHGGAAHLSKINVTVLYCLNGEPFQYCW